MSLGSCRLLERIRIVLVEPSHPGNIGGAARALKTMGLHQLVLVNPLRYPDPQAQWRAAGAQDVLDNTQVVATLDEAIGDCHWVVGTSTRSRRIPWPVASAQEVVEMCLNQPQTAEIAILFGRETNGLANDELQRCHCHLQIPANPEYPVLNLAMAVQVVCYELCKQVSQLNDTYEPQPWDRRPATMAQVEGLLTHFSDALISSEFIDQNNPGQTLTRLRRLFARVQLDETEVQMLRGMLRSFSHSAPEGE